VKEEEEKEEVDNAQSLTSSCLGDPFGKHNIFTFDFLKPQ
jgi:hypothetical protein